MPISCPFPRRLISFSILRTVLVPLCRMPEAYSLRFVRRRLTSTLRVDVMFDMMDRVAASDAALRGMAMESDGSHANQSTCAFTTGCDMPGLWYDDGSTSSEGTVAS